MARRLIARERLHGVHVFPQREGEDLGAIAAGAMMDPRPEKSVARRQRTAGDPLRPVTASRAKIRPDLRRPHLESRMVDDLSEPGSQLLDAASQTSMVTPVPEVSARLSVRVALSLSSLKNRLPVPSTSG